jgi:hypothetical protein
MRRLFTSLSIAAFLVVSVHIAGSHNGPRSLKAAETFSLKDLKDDPSLKLSYVLLRKHDGRFPRYVPILVGVRPTGREIELRWPDTGEVPPKTVDALFSFSRPGGGADLMVSVNGLAGQRRVFPLSGDPLQTFGTNLLLDQLGPLNVLRPTTKSYPLPSKKIELKSPGGEVHPDDAGRQLEICLEPVSQPNPQLSPAVQPVAIEAGTIKDTDGTSDLMLDWLGTAPRVKALLEIDFMLDGVPVAGTLKLEDHDFTLNGKTRVVMKPAFLAKLNAFAAPLLTGTPPRMDPAKKPKLTGRTLTITPTVDGIALTPIVVAAPFDIQFQGGQPKASPQSNASDAGKASQAAEATASAAAEAVERGETVDGVMNAVNVMVDAYEVVRNPAGARAARAVANAVGAKADQSTSSPQDVADAARTWADAIKAAEGQSVTGKASDSISTADSGVDLSKDLPPASAKAAFESILPIGKSPSMSAAGDYEYGLFAATKRVLPTIIGVPVLLLPQRRIGFFAVKYETPDQPWLAEGYARFAAWTGARAVRSQLVSLANPGLGYNVYLRKNESLVIGSCSFDDVGNDPRYDWFAFERDVREPQLWQAYTVTPRKSNDPQDQDVVKPAPIERFTDARVPLGLRSHVLTPSPPGIASLLHRHLFELPRFPSSTNVRVVISGDILTFSIEVGIKVYDSFHLAGQYQRDYFPTPERGSRSAFEERLQYGAVKLRSAAPPSWKALERAAIYGADVLRRRGESLVGPEELRTEQLGDNNHLVLFVRNSLTGDTSWLAVKSMRGDGLQVTTSVAQANPATQNPYAYPLESPGPPSPGLASPYVPKGGPACSYPLFLGGEQGSRLVEVWIVQKNRMEGRPFATPTTLFDVQYLFLRPQ